MTAALLLLVPVIIGLIAWLEYLRTARYIVRETQSTEGLNHLAEAARGYRAPKRRPSEEPKELE